MIDNPCILICMSHPREPGELARAFIEVANRARADFAAAVAGVGLPISSARALLVMEGRAPMRQIAEKLGCDPSYVTEIADHLEQEGLAVRATGEDRRVKMLELTHEGDRFKRLVAQAVENRGQFGHRLSTQQRLALEEILQVLLDEHQ